MIQRILKLIVCALSFTTNVAFADLIQRTALEDALRNRVQKAVDIFDTEARIFVQVRYKDFKGPLPGSTINISSSIPANPDIEDIAAVQITIYSKRVPFEADAEKTIASALPIPPALAKIEYKKWEFTNSVVTSERLTPQNLSTLLNSSWQAVWEQLRFGALILAVVFAFVAVALGMMRASSIKAQTRALVEAASKIQSSAEAPMARAQQAGPMPMETGASTVTSGAGFTSNGPKYLEQMALDSIIEILADCYWCQREGYAHYVWRELSLEKREKILAKVDFMNDYVSFFMTKKPVNLNLHEHPYYLAPAPLWSTAQDDLKKQIEKNPKLWSRLSPLRQSSLTLPLSVKIEGLADGKAPAKLVPMSARSTPRDLPVTVDFGDLSIDDEMQLFNAPEEVPNELRPQVKSLVWLAHKDAAFVKECLSKWDAKALAEAWIGPEPVLAQLEKQMPEKKLTLMKDYLTKVKPSRRSPVFLSLAQEGASNIDQINDEKQAA